MQQDATDQKLDQTLHIFDGEGWFFYWKVSSSLWKSRIEQMQNLCKRVIIPVNWAFHHVAPDRFDFVGSRPETNLKRLVSIANEAGLEAVFLVPLTPCPLIANGGLPSFLSKNRSTTASVLPQKIVMPDGSLNQFYSFYDQNVFLAFSNFVSTLAQYFSRSGIASSIFSVEYGHLDQLSFFSHFNDWSPCFEAAFFRYLKARAQKEYEQEMERVKSELAYRQELESEFRQSIRDLYFSAAQEGLSPNYEGHLKVHALSGLRSSSLSLFPNQGSLGRVIEETVHCAQKGVCATSACLPKKFKTPLLSKVFRDLVIDEVYPGQFEADAIAGEGALGFQCLNLMQVFEETSRPQHGKGIRKTGLLKHLNQSFDNSFRISDLQDFKFDEESISINDPINYFCGQSMNEKTFNDILKAFMQGQQILLDRSGIDKKLLKRLELFLLENNLNVEKVNFLVEIHNVRLGEGRMTIFRSEPLCELDFQKQKHFWSKLLETFQIRHLELELAEELISYWRTRPANSNELDYEEIRRLYVINATSYLKKGKLNVKKNFALKKIVDEKKANVNNNSGTVEFEILPGGELVIDIGVFS